MPAIYVLVELSIIYQSVISYFIYDRVRYSTLKSSLAWHLFGAFRLKMVIPTRFERVTLRLGI